MTESNNQSCSDERSAAVEFAKSEWENVKERDHFSMKEDGIPILVTATKRSRNDAANYDNNDIITYADANKRRKGLNGTRILLDYESMDDEDDVNRHTTNDVDNDDNNNSNQSLPSNKKLCESENNLLGDDAFASPQSSSRSLIICSAEEENDTSDEESQVENQEKPDEASIAAVISTLPSAIITLPLRSILKACGTTNKNNRTNNRITFAAEDEIREIEGRTDEQIQASNERKRKRDEAKGKWNGWVESSPLTKRVIFDDETSSEQHESSSSNLICCSSPDDDDIAMDDDESTEETSMIEKPIHLWHESKADADEQQSDKSTICVTLNSIVHEPFFTETHIIDVKTQIAARFDANHLRNLKESSYTLLVMAWALAPLGLQLIECSSSHPKAQALRSGDTSISDITHAFVGLFTADGGNEWNVVRKVGNNWFEFN